MISSIASLIVLSVIVYISWDNIIPFIKKLIRTMKSIQKDGVGQ